jgi:uncharacterized protein YbbC (DUF1343 family)/CubicO group peptidase (beta-lactamase class C family)
VLTTPSGPRRTARGFARAVLPGPWLAPVAVVLVWAAAAFADPPADWRAAVDAAADDATAAGDVPGVVILVGQGERTLHRRARGLRAPAPAREPMTVDTVFDIASLTKVVATTPAVLALWEDGRLELEAPLARYLPELSGTAAGTATVQAVLLHASGLPEVGAASVGADGLNGIIRAVARGPSRGPAGEFRYGDTGFVLLGEIVRRVGGIPLDEFVGRRFFRPMGLRHTGFNPPAGWRARIAPTGTDGETLRGVVHDPLARRLGGVAGHAGLFSTAQDLARFCRMLLEGGRLGGYRFLRESTVRTMFEAHPVGEALRGLGWDMASPFSRTLGAFFPAGSVGHTGFTGPAVWLDRRSQAYLIVLANRLGSASQPRVAELRRRVSAAVGAQLFGDDRALDRPTIAVTLAPGSPGAGTTRTGLDRLVAQEFASLAGRSIGLVTNQTGVDRQGRRGADLLAAAPGLSLRALFAPEHGLGGDRDDAVPHGRDAATGLPVWSLYGAVQRPTPAMLAGLDTLVFDIQDVGVRYYTYLATLVAVLEEAARHDLAVVVLDRPNPLTGRVVEGPLGDADLRSFTAPHPLPVRTGLTIGEFARMVVAERRLPVRLTVVPLEGWQRGRWFDQTGLPWVNPSPNVRSPEQALLYAGVGLLEATNLSVGRGTASPFTLVGAPWIADPTELVERLDAHGLPGVRFEPAAFTPTSSTYAGQAVRGLRLVVTDREAIRPATIALAVARELMDRYPGEFRPAAIQDLLVNRVTLWALLRGVSVARLRRGAEADAVAFGRRRAPYELYP